MPSLFWWTQEPSPAAASRVKRAALGNARRCRLSETLPKGQEDEDILGMSELYLNMETVVELAEGLTVDEVVQTDFPCLTTSQTQTSEEVPIEILRISIDQFKRDPEGVKLSTGLEDYNIYVDVLASLGPAAYHLNYLYGNPSIDVKHQLFLALMKCRMYQTNTELSRMFKINETKVYSTFITWIRFMSLQWKELDIWPE